MKNKFAFTHCCEANLISNWNYFCWHLNYKTELRLHSNLDFLLPHVIRRTCCLMFLGNNNLLSWLLKSKGKLVLFRSRSSPARTLGLWVRIALEAWICVCLLCVCVVLCVGSGLATGWSRVQAGLPSMCRLRNWKSGQSPKGCRVI
jgi:hypothetical protein